jgi:hypothetical protein
LLDVLALIAKLSHNNVHGDMLHTLIIDHMELPEHEIHKHIHELESLGLVRIQSQMNHLTGERGREYSLNNITREGLHKSSSDQTLDKTTPGLLGLIQHY